MGNADISRLIEIGFIHVGHWKSITGKLTCDLNQLAGSANVLYAFVVKDRVMYVGKTRKSLRMRMSGYRCPGHRQSTNIRIKAHIKECVEQGLIVHVHAFPDTGLLRHGAFHLNVADGLEESLIEQLSPLWNGGNKESAGHPQKRRDARRDEEEPTLLSSPPPRQADFLARLLAIFNDSETLEEASVDVNAGKLHRDVGGYPGSQGNHRMPVCCSAMRKVLRDGDIITAHPRKGPNADGASFTVKYLLPRPSL